MENFLYLAQTETNAAIVIFNILFVFALELVIAWVYRKTHRTLSYSQSFIFTMILMGVIASLIMMIVAENIVGAFALLGAFALIRFRTIVKETRDISFVFFSLAIGVAVGTNNYVIAILGTVLISLITLILDRYNFGSLSRTGYILVISAREPFIPENKASWHDLTPTQQVLNIKSISDGLREYTLGISLKNESDASKLVDSLRTTNGVETIELMNGREAIEY